MSHQSGSGSSSSSGNAGSYSYTSSGTNSQGNHYCSRDYGSSAANSNSYHYSNSNGSYYYSNPNGSTYCKLRSERIEQHIEFGLTNLSFGFCITSDNNGSGGSTYTPSSGNHKQISRRVASSRLLLPPRRGLSPCSFLVMYTIE